ncbi:MAG: hypothetical protein LQ339_002134 [Xanthoria mediterranea]|nr:MAG: hypothetical protein LQ339_002134 [Xanthoria mediterranea]
MAPIDPAPAWFPLRSVTRRLTSTPVAQLPYIAPSLACTISTCGEVLRSIEEQNQKKSQSELSVLVHKFRTQLSTLLQDRSKEARWAVVVLVKATVEAGGWSVLPSSDKWVRALLGMIGKSEPSTTKKLSIIVLTRIFLLTQDHPSLIRELATPSLPPFFTTCLRLVGESKGNGPRQPIANDSILSTVLWAFAKLLPHHPAACRPFVGQIRALVLPLIAPCASSLSTDGITDTPCSQIVVQRARQVFVLLCGCAPKNNQGLEWNQSLSTAIDMSHQTADLVFRALIEDWEPIDPGSLHDRTGLVTVAETLSSHKDGSGLPGWKGISAGLERLDGLLLTLQAHLMFPTAAPVIIPVSKILNLLDRMLSALPPSEKASKDTGKGTRTNPEIGRDERETLWTGLPLLHVSAIKVLETLIARLGECPMALNYRLLDYVLSIFEQEHSQIQIRKTVYRVVSLLLPRCRSGLPQMVASSLDGCVRMCCEDLLPVQPGSKISYDTGTPKLDVSKGSPSADAYSGAPRTSLVSSAGTSEVQRMAEQMLFTALAHLPSSFFRLSLRSRIDQTAILAQSNLMLRTSVLNAPNYHRRQQQSSLLPFLARQSPQDSSTEALLRPRLPPVQRILDYRLMDDPQEAEDRETIYQEEAGQSPTMLDRPEDSPIPLDVESKEQEQLALNFKVPLNEGPSGDSQSAVEFPSKTDRQTFSHIPAKRSLEVDLDSMNENPLGEPKQVLASATEPASKRLREGNGIYIPPVTKDDLPPPVVMDQREDHSPRSPELSASPKPSASLRPTKEDIDDDSSDDSSIPSMDLTLATDDDEDEEFDVE